MRIYILQILLLTILLNTVKSQTRLDFAVELAAFDQSVPLSYFKNIDGVYETIDVNLIYRYHIAATTQEDAAQTLTVVKQKGFPNARIIDFNYIKSVCEAQCGYVPPRKTATSGLSSANNTKAIAAKADPRKTFSLNATDLLGANAVVLPDNFEDNADMDWLDFLNKNKGLGLTNEELEDVYKKHGNIKIEQADWFRFKKLNADLGASNAELMEFYIKHGNIKIEQADWFRFKSEKDAAWLSFKNKNTDLGATDDDLLALFKLHGDIKISRAIWENYVANKAKTAVSPAISNNNTLSKTSNATTPNTKVTTIGFVMFEFGGIIFSSDNKIELDKLAAALVKNKNLNIKLIGHADAIGNDIHNQALSLRRASAVNQYLTQYGVSAKQISIQGKGESTPIAINSNNDGSDSPEGRKYNRRVDLLVLDPDGNPVQIVSAILIPAHLLAK